MREKRILSVFLAVVLCVSMLPVSALAEENIILSGEELLSLVEKAVEAEKTETDVEEPAETEESVSTEIPAETEAPEETAVPEVTVSPTETEEEVPAAEFQTPGISRFFAQFVTYPFLTDRCPGRPVTTQPHRIRIRIVRMHLKIWR